MSNVGVSYSSVVSSGGGSHAQNKSQRGGGGGGSRGRSKVIRNSNQNNHQQQAKPVQNIQQNGQQQQKQQRPQHGGTKSPGGHGGLNKQPQNLEGVKNPFQVFASGGANGKQDGAANLGALLSNMALKSGTSNGRSGLKVASPDEEIRKLNINTIQRGDPGFGEILTSASQVAVYDYSHETGNWTDSKTAGCFFIYKRTLHPDFGLCVLNRKGLKNLVLSFDKNSQVIPQKPNLLFRPGPTDGGSSPIKCLWFYKDSDFDKTIELLRSLGVHFDQLNQQAGAETQMMNENLTSGNQIFSMLQNSQPVMTVPNGVPAQIHQNAINVEQLEQQDIDMDPAICMVRKSATGPDQKFSPAVPLNASADHIALNGIMGPSLNEASHSAMMQMRTVEQLEKDMVPSDKNSVAIGSKSLPPSKKDISNDLLATLGIKPSETAKSSSSPKSSQYVTPASRSRSESSRSSRKVTIDDLDGKLYDDTDEEMVREVVDSLTDLGELLLLYENVDGKSEPQLVWRKRSNLQSRPASALIRIHQNTNQSPPQSQARVNVNSTDLNCLTKNQLLQAMNYLLQNDSDFVTKIHDAYVRSLQTAWTGKTSQS